MKSSSLPRTSIEYVTPGDIVILNDGMIRSFQALVTEFEKPGGMSRDVIITKIGEFIGSLPRPLRNEIQDEEGLRNELADVMQAFCGTRKEAPTEKEIENLVAQFFSIVLQHQVFAHVSNRALDNKALEADFEPEIKSRYNSLTLQRLVSAVIWVVSAFTSWLGLTHYVGKFGIVPLEKLLVMKFHPTFAVLLRHAIAILGSGAVSQLVQNFKEDIEREAHEKNIGLFRATGKATAKHKNVMIALGALVLAFDVGTNINGIVTAVEARHSLQNQIASATGEIGGRVEGVRGQMKKIDEVPGKVKADVNELLRNEDSGSSESGKSGIGPVYHAKALAYTEAGESATELDTSDFGKQLKDAVHASGVLNARTIDQELTEDARASLGRVEAILEDIASQEKQMSPSDEVEVLQQKLDGIVESIEEVVGIINKDIPESFGERLKPYDALNERLFQILTSSGKYPGARPDKIKKWTLPDLEMDNTEIKIERIKYIEFSELWKVMKQNMMPSQATIFLTIAIILGILSSYLDLATLPSSRRAYAKDRDEAAMKRAKFTDAFKEKIAMVITRALNEGPFSQFFKQREQLAAETVTGALNSRIAELSVLTRDKPFFRKLSRIFPISPSADYKGKTEIAQRHNAEVAALQQVMSSPQELALILEEVIPGLKILQLPRTQQTLPLVREKTDVFLEGENDAIQKEKILSLASQVMHLNRMLFPKPKTIKQWDFLEERRKKLQEEFDLVKTSLRPHNERLFEDESRSLRRVSDQVNSLLPETISYQTHEYQLSKFRAFDDVALLEIEENLRNCQEKLDSYTPANQDAEQAAIDAKKGVAAALHEIAAVREERSKGMGEGQRSTERLQRMQEAQRAFQRMEAWEESLIPGGDSRTEMDKLADLLGHRFLVHNLATADSRISPIDQGRLEAEFVKLKQAFRVLETDPQREKRVRELESVLEAQMIGLRLLYEGGGGSSS